MSNRQAITWIKISPVVWRRVASLGLNVFKQIFDLLWPSDDIGRYITRSTLTTVMACWLGWRHQAITWTNGDLSSVRSSDIYLRTDELPQPSITKNSFEITHLQLHLISQGHLNHFVVWDVATICENMNPDSKGHGANMGPTWVLSSPGGLHVGPMNFATWELTQDTAKKSKTKHKLWWSVAISTFHVLTINWFYDKFVNHHIDTQIAKFMGPTWFPPGFCRPQMGPMLAPWNLLSGQFMSFEYKKFHTH